MITFKAIRDVASPIRDGKNAGYDLFTPKATRDFIERLYELNKDYFDGMFSYHIMEALNSELFTNTVTTSESAIIGEKISKEIIINDLLDSYEGNGIELKTYNNSFNIKVPSGLIYKMDETDREGFTKEFHITNKSGVASKYSVITGACVCDMEYRDEVLINIIGFKEFTLKPNFKLAQGIIREVSIESISFVPYGDETDIFAEVSTNRGGGFGSTGETI